MTDEDNEKLRDLFARQEKLAELRADAEKYRTEAEALRAQHDVLAYAYPDLAPALKAEYEPAIAKLDSQAHNATRDAREFDAQLVADWTENSHLMGGLTKEQAAELATFENERKQRQEAERARAELDAQLDARVSREESESELQKLLRETVDERRQRNKDRDRDR